MKARLAALGTEVLLMKTGLTMIAEHGIQGIPVGLAGLAGRDWRLFDNQGDGACPLHDVRR